ncbi:MAG: hypothetical protein SOZ90_07540 [Candidatus Faecousia sp.]|nr:hypothetical protein [Candidatus Faecousia sp.]
MHDSAIFTGNHRHIRRLRAAPSPAGEGFFGFCPGVYEFARALAVKLNGVPCHQQEKHDRVVAKVLNRDNSVLDMIYGV